MAMKNPTKTYRLALIGVMTAILCILGPLSIPLPFSPVPLSLTNFAILLAVFLLGWKWGTVSCGIYLLLGLVGVPVFSRVFGRNGKTAWPNRGLFGRLSIVGCDQRPVCRKV